MLLPCQRAALQARLRFICAFVCLLFDKSRDLVYVMLIGQCPLIFRIVARPHTRHSIKDGGVVTRDELRGKVQILRPSAGGQVDQALLFSLAF